MKLTDMSLVCLSLYLLICVYGEELVLPISNSLGSIRLNILSPPNLGRSRISIIAIHGMNPMLKDEYRTSFLSQTLLNKYKYQLILPDFHSGGEEIAPAGVNDFPHHTLKVLNDNVFHTLLLYAKDDKVVSSSDILMKKLDISHLTVRTVETGKHRIFEEYAEMIGNFISKIY